MIFTIPSSIEEPGGADMDVSKLAKEMAVYCQQRAATERPSHYRAIRSLILVLLAGGPPTIDKNKFWNIT
mgnify:CR=1 FL=1